MTDRRSTPWHRFSVPVQIIAIIIGLAFVAGVTYVIARLFASLF